MENQQSEALRLADIVERLNVGVHSQAIVEECSTAARELRRQHARIQELEAMLESIGAGGVSAQRITQAAQAPATAIQERDKFEQLMAASYPNLSFERHSYQYDHNRFAQYKVQWLWEGWQARAALDASDHIEQPLEMVAAQEPFGYFKAEPFGWTDCSETDEGARPLYEAPQPQADALDTERLDWLIEQGCSHGVVYEGPDKSFWMVWLDGHDAHKDKHQICRYHTAREAIDAAIAAAKENK